MSESRDLLYVRGFRNVEPNTQLERFLANFKDEADGIYGDKDSVLKPQMQQGAGRGYSGRAVGIPAVKVYDASNLRFTHFNLAAEYSSGVEGIMRRMYTKSEQIKQKVGMTAMGIDDVEVTAIVSAPDPYYKHLGLELALQINPDSMAAAMLSDQSRLIYEFFQKTGAGKEVIGDVDYQPVAPLIPFARLPKNAAVATDQAARQEQLVRNTEVYLPIGNLALSRVLWQPRS